MARIVAIRSAAAHASTGDGSACVTKHKIKMLFIWLSTRYTTHLFAECSIDRLVQTSDKLLANSPEHRRTFRCVLRCTDDICVGVPGKCDCCIHELMHLNLQRTSDTDRDYCYIAPTPHHPNRLNIHAMWIHLEVNEWIKTILLAGYIHLLTDNANVTPICCSGMFTCPLMVGFGISGAYCIGAGIADQATIQNWNCGGTKKELNFGNWRWVFVKDLKLIGAWAESCFRTHF